MANGYNQKNYSPDEVKAYYMGRGFELARKGLPIVCTSKEQRESFSNGCHSVKKTKTKKKSK